MKKTMFGLACAAAMVACADVGYTTATSIENNNFVAVPFAAVGCNTADIQQIKISDGGVGDIGWGTETFDVWEGLPEVVEGSSFLYTDPSIDPTGEATDYYWADFDGNPVSYSISAGQGFVLGLTEGLEVTIEAPYSL